MKTVNLNSTFGMLSLIAVLSCGFAVPSTAQTISKITTPRAFTVAPKVSSPIVLRTTPDAASICMPGCEP